MAKNVDDLTIIESLHYQISLLKDTEDYYLKELDRKDKEISNLIGEIDRQKGEVTRVKKIVERKNREIAVGKGIIKDLLKKTVLREVVKSVFD